MTQREQRVTPLELFFDLVFVCAITQVTLLMSNDATWSGTGRGLLVLAALWWAWTGYAWLTNALEPEEGEVRAGMFAAMAAMLVVALAVPEAFDADAVLFGSPISSSVCSTSCSTRSPVGGTPIGPAPSSISCRRRRSRPRSSSPPASSTGQRRQRSG
jgi:Bacterial low temperature requirement A protein (LtrA)